ncbi:HD-GYP domain-containing protein [Effusibacillus dendaii]|uniref:HD-GYP domain-containing protein n=1 Tax=Effusibacillus dendaii TaxID=2743772 RepID=A0A7I8DHV0_9BACL|nr:HD-GYP domain-containing protein [Effusibacillus dendaii]BCJ88200.1 hypothetical protein skT53_31850 [Effusibacillus dendaii]
MPVSSDSIDVANRILLYFILATYSYLLFKTLFENYNKQVTVVTEALETTIEQVVASFIVAIEAKDQYTFGHSERVSLYAVEMAKTLREYEDDNKLKTLRLSGLMHDVGKINIPESILTKPDKLTPEEYELIKTHTVVGARMVEKITGLGPLKNGVLYHHERWDGRGYPAELQGEEIPLDARILAIADAFDAMTSSRAYRDALSFHEAFNRLKEARGTQFDPKLIDCLESVRFQWLQIYNESQFSLDDLEKLTDFL